MSEAHRGRGPQGAGPTEADFEAGALAEAVGRRQDPVLVYQNPATVEFPFVVEQHRLHTHTHTRTHTHTHTCTHTHTHGHHVEM